MSAVGDFFDGLLRPLPRPVYCNLIASVVYAALKAAGAKVDQHQSNGLWCIHQLRVELDGKPYRILICPDDAPVTIGSVPADQHFLEPLVCRMPANDIAATG